MTAESVTLVSTGVLQYLDISTEHVSEKTMEWFDDTSCESLTITPYTYGAFVGVPPTSSDVDTLECPDDLKEVLRYARRLECDVVRFDRDAGTFADLPQYQ